MTSCRDRKIEITGTISNHKISLSQPPETPVILTLNLCLLESDEPITFCISHSFLSGDPAIADSAFTLMSSEGKWAETMIPLGNLNTGACFDINADKDLLTLSPGTSTQVKIDVGIGHARERNWLCSSAFEWLENGETYEIKYSGGGRHCYPAWWWMIGTKEEILQQRVPFWCRLFGVRSFVASFSDMSLEQLSSLGVVMNKGPKIHIED